MLAGALGVAACGGDSGGGGDPPPEKTGVPIICGGTFVNRQTGEQRQFPCRRNGTSCDPIPADEIAQQSCGVASATVNGQERTIVPGFDRADLEDGFCACKLADVPADQQAGSCQSVCEQVVLKSPNLNNNDVNGPWQCKDVITPQDAARIKYTCTPGSIVFLNGGPSEYLVRLVGSQTTGGSVDLGFTTISRSASSNLDGWLTYSTSDRSRGCGTAGCRMVLNQLGLKVDPFHIDGFSIEVLGVTVFSFDGVNLEDAGIMNQGYFDGVVFDDGHFSLPPGSARLFGNIDTGSSSNLFTAVAQTISGHVDFATGDIDFDPFSIPGGDGQMTVTMSGSGTGGPPQASIATPSVFECTSPAGTNVVLDATTTVDPDGDGVSFAWQLDGRSAGTGARHSVLVPLGVSEVHLDATDTRLSVGRAVKTITVQDTTAPAFVAPGDADLTSCDPQVDVLPLAPLGVSDACTGVSDLAAFLVVENGVTLATPRRLDIGAARLAGGQHVVQWVATDGAGNQSRVDQTVRVGPAIQATDHLELRDRSTVLNGRNLEAAVGSIGAGQSQIGVQARLAEIQSVGPIFLQNFATVTGRATSEGAITMQQGATVGILQQHTPVDLGNIPWLQGVSGTVFDGADVTVPPDTVRVFATASFGRLQVMSRSRVTIPAHALIRELWLEPDATLVLQGTTAALVIRDRFIDRGSVVASQPGTQGQILVLGDELRLEKPLQGLGLIAPNAHVTVTTMASATRVPVLAGRTVEVQPDAKLFCDRGATIPSR